MTLLADFDASVNTNVFENFPGTDTAEDNDNILHWKSESSLDFSARPTSGDGEAPNWDSDGIGGIGAIVFDGVNESSIIRAADGTTAKALSTLLGASEFTVIAVIYVTATPSNQAAIYNNHCVFADTGGYIGMHLRNSGGSQPQVCAYTYDGTEAVVPQNITINTAMLVRMRREGTTLYIGIDGGTDASATGGMPSVQTNSVRLAESIFQPSSPVRLGQLRFYDTGSAASTNSDVTSLMSKWGLSSGPFEQSAGGVLAPSGTLTKMVMRSIAGSIAPSGAQSRSTIKVVAGSLPSAGAMTRRTDRVIVGSIQPQGAPTKATATDVAGVVVPAGALAQSLVSTQSVSGLLAPSGTLTRVTQRTVTGGLQPTGAQPRETRRSISGVLSSIVGSLMASTADQQSAAGSVAPSGAMTRLIMKILPEDIGQTTTGELPLSGALSRVVSKALSGAIAPAGALTRVVTKNVAGSVTPSSSVQAQSGLSALVSGALSIAGDVSVVVFKSIAGALAPAGAMTRSTLRSIAGSIAPAGALAAGELTQITGGTLGISGTLTTSHRVAPYKLVKGTPQSKVVK